MQASLKDRPTGRPLRLNVGINDVLPKYAAYRLLAPAFSLTEAVQVVCLEDNAERLLAQLAMHVMGAQVMHPLV